MTKVVGFVALHYGKDYLGYAIRSVIDAIDELHIAYTPIGSHGYRTITPCPETRDELYAIASDAAGSKLHWHEGEWVFEGQQRDSIFQYAPDADVILVVDADEVWSETLAQSVIESYAYDSNLHYSRLRLSMVHYWRSFYRCIVHDPAFPERVIFPKVNGKTITVSTPRVIHHMGYAQRPEIIQYKQLTHGHRGEWRQDINWFQDRFLANAQVDCHPVGSDWWSPEDVDPFALGLPEFMREHEYAKLEVIE